VYAAIKNRRRRKRVLRHLIEILNVNLANSVDISHVRQYRANSITFIYIGVYIGVVYIIKEGEYCSIFIES